MEVLKPFAELTEPDQRQTLFSVVNPRSRMSRPLMLADVYAAVASIQLNAEVPEEIRSHFATALNLLVYAWNFYPFNATAQLMGYTTLEKALKLIYPEPLASKRPQSFGDLVRRAADDGRLDSAQFSHLQPDAGSAAAPVDIEVDGGGASYARVLVQVLPKLRNTLAHGSTIIHGDGVSHVRFCAEFINLLFPNLTAKVDRNGD